MLARCWLAPALALAAAYADSMALEAWPPLHPLDARPHAALLASVFAAAAGARATAALLLASPTLALAAALAPVAAPALLPASRAAAALALALLALRVLLQHRGAGGHADMLATAE